MHTALILAGGEGRRMGRDIPKQFLKIAGKPLLLYSLEAFERHALIDAIAVVCPPAWRQAVRALAEDAGITKLKWTVDAGSTRSLSSYQGLLALRESMNDRDIVLIHDAARPFLTHRIISDNIRVAQRYGAANTALPSVDTVLQSLDGQTAEKVLDRAQLYISQTPQTFRYGLIVEAYRRFFESGADTATCDCSVARLAGYTVGLCEGSRMNIKVTTAEDLPIAETFVKVYILSDSPRAECAQTNAVRSFEAAVKPEE